MAKTITLRINDETYALIKRAAEGDRRSISNYIEYATMAFLTEESFASDQEMQEILHDEELLKDIKMAETDIQKGNYRIVE